MLERLEHGPAQQVLAREQVLLPERGPARLREPDPQQLAGVVPLVERLGAVHALVALQPDQRRAEARGEGARRLSLADAGLALEQQRLREPQRQEERRGEALVGQVAGAVEQRGDGLRPGDRGLQRAAHRAFAASTAS
jgi:hypothetical protein